MHWKEDDAELLKDLWTHLGQLLQPETPEDFIKEWEFFQSEYADQKSSWGIWKRSGFLKKGVLVLSMEKSETFVIFVIFNSISSH